jgi:hypothetical protein
MTISKILGSCAANKWTVWLRVERRFSHDMESKKATITDFYGC